MPYDLFEYLKPELAVHYYVTILTLALLLLLQVQNIMVDSGVNEVPTILDFCTLSASPFHIILCSCSLLLHVALSLWYKNNR